MRSVTRRTRLTAMALAIAMVAGNTAQITAQTQDIPSRKVESATEFNASCMSDGLWTGSVVIAATAESTVFRQAWGYTSADKTVEMPEDAIFDLASLTKPVAVATAVAICMDRGWIDISAPFVQYLPEYQGQLQETVTVLDLARHVSGFDNSKPYLDGKRVIADVMHHSPVRPPRQQFEYSCCNYILLGLIVEKASGHSLSRFCREAIFDPLSMQNTQWTPLQKPDSRVVKSIFTPALGVASDNPARAAGRPIGNAGLFSTADDLARFCRMMLANGTYDGKRLLSKRAMRELSIKSDERSPLALGWFVDKSKNPPSLSDATLSHTGWTGNSLWIDPAQQCFVIVLTNRTGDHSRAINARIKLAEHVLSQQRKGLRLSHGS